MKSKSDGSVLISDLSIARPQSALAEMPKKNCWYSMNYELVDGSKGVMLSADPHFRAAEIEIPLDVSGVYRVFIGVNYFSQPYNKNPYGALWLKLTGERGSTRVGIQYNAGVEDSVTASDAKNTIHETYWRTADLTGKSLIVNIPKPPYESEFYRRLTNISFIRLEPAKAEELELMEDLSHSKKNMAVIWCAGALTGHTRGHYMYHPRNRQWFEDDFEAYRNSDFGIFCMEAIRGNLCLFKTKHGDTGALDKSWGEDWADPLAEFTRLAHDAGMKMFVSMRLIGGGRTNAFNPINWARSFWENPQWAKRDKEGNLCANLSLAYEAARQHWLALLREALDYGIDGVVLYLNRCYPFVMYEEPAVASFKEKHGIDPRELPEDDERWQRHVASYVTQFVREVRALLDEKPGRELAVIFKYVSDFKPGALNDGCDPDTWIREGLIDYLFHDETAALEYISYWKELGKGRLKLYPSLMPRQQPGAEYARLARSLYAEGADGFCVWDCERRIQRTTEWNVCKHLGHKNRLEYFEQNAPDYYRANRLKLLRGLDVSFSYADG